VRNHIEHLSESDVPWSNYSPGVYGKMLNHNAVTGERTALVRFVPSEGAKAPNKHHFHSFYEELFVLEGKMTFDHKLWLGSRSYVYHPPFMVHGFNSGIPETTTLIARAPCDLDFNFPDGTHEGVPFYIDGKQGSRDFAYLNLPSENRWQPVFGRDRVQIGCVFELSRDTVTHEGSRLVRLFEGAAVPEEADGYAYFDEGYVIEGTIGMRDGRVRSAGDYWHLHPGTPIPGMTVKSTALLFSTLGPE
jgi:hypothetical protein